MQYNTGANPRFDALLVSLCGERTSLPASSAHHKLRNKLDFYVTE